MSRSPLRAATLPIVAAFAVLAAALGAADVAALPLVFHPGETLDFLRLFPHQGQLVATWDRGIASIDPATGTSQDLDAASYHIEPMPVAGSEVFFYAHSSASVDLLKAIRGTEAITLPGSIDPQVHAGTRGNLIYTTFARGLDLHASDGTPAGTGELLDLDPDWTYFCPILCPPGINSPHLILAAPTGRIYFAVMAGDFSTSYSTEIWTRDPAADFPGLPPATAPEPRRLAILPIDPLLTFVTGDGRLFYVPDEAGRSVLTTSDGSEAGTRAVATFEDAVPDGALAAIHDPVEWNGLVYFWVERAARRELWRSDGSSEGTVKVKDFGFGPRAGAIWAAASRLYLAVDAEGVGEELWISDGSEAGTRLVADLYPGQGGSRPRSLVALPDGRVALSLDDGVHGAEPFVSDGTAAGTTLLADALPGSAGSHPADFVPLAGRLFFVGDPGDGRRVPSYLELPLEGVCPADKLCLQDGRFEVQITYSAAGGSGLARRATASRDSGIVSFFSPDNWEVMVKVLDGCAINDRFWVFAAAATDVAYEIRVKDLATQLEKVYPHPGGSPAPALTDLEAFATCPDQP